MELGRIEAPQNRSIGSWRYAKGRLAALGDRLMSADQVDRLFSLQTVRELVPLMQELAYRGDDFAAALAEGEAADWELMAQIVPEAETLHCLLLFRDAHNLKACLRAVLPTGRDIDPKQAESFFLRPYLYSGARLLGEICRELKRPVPPAYDVQGELPEWVGRLIHRAEQSYRKFNDSAEIDRAVDLGMWEELQLAAAQANCPWFASYLELKRRLQNLEMLLRCRTLNLSHSYLADSLLPCSDEERELLVSSLRLPAKDLEQRLFSGEFRALAPLAKEYGEKGGAAYYSAVADRILLDKLREAKRGEGAESVLFYFLGRECDRRSLRVAHSAIENKFSEERRRQMRRPAVQ